MMSLSQRGLTYCRQISMRMSQTFMASNQSKVRYIFLITRFVNPFPKKPWFLRVCSTSLLKTLWEKEKLLMLSNFSFSHSVFQQFGELPAIFVKLGIGFCKFSQFRRVQNLLFGKGLIQCFGKVLIQDFPGLPNTSAHIYGNIFTPFWFKE